MSLLSICAAAAAEMGLDASPVSIVGNPGADEQRLLRFANRVGRDLASRAPWQALRRQRAFTATATEVQAFSIPADFGRFYPETFFDQTNFRSITGPLSATDYDSRKLAGGFVGAPGGQRWFTRRGNDLLVTPRPIGGEAYTFDYQSSAFCQSAAGVPQSQWLADSDTGLLNEELMTLGVIAFFLAADGQPAQLQRADYERRLHETFANDSPTGRVMAAGDMFAGVRHSTGEPSGMPAMGRLWW